MILDNDIIKSFVRIKSFLEFIIEEKSLDEIKVKKYADKHLTNFDFYILNSMLNFTKDPKTMYKVVVDVLDYKKKMTPHKTQNTEDWNKLLENAGTPYFILGIEEKEYTREELLEIVKKKVDELKSMIKDEQQQNENIDLILDAYNEIMGSKKIK